MRLDRLLSMAGYSRSEARAMIAAGRVRVNGAVVRDPGAQADAGVALTLDGAPADVERELYIMLHKPAGVVTATEDKKLPTVVDLLPENLRRRRIGPVGRLDRDVTGLVILTTDGQLAHRLISPKYKAEKCYRAVCEGRLGEGDVAAFARGVELSDFTARGAGMAILEAGESSVADVTLTEGKFHEVKRMFAAIGHPLLSLKRLRIGCVVLDDSLAEGAWRRLTEEEVAGLKALSGLDGEDT